MICSHYLVSGTTTGTVASHKENPGLLLEDINSSHRFSKGCNCFKCQENKDGALISMCIHGIRKEIYVG